jgi:hypothetical protein
MDSTASPSRNVLVHHGVKGMHWGIRKDEPGGIDRLQVSSGIQVDSNLPKSTQEAGKRIASLITKRYGFPIVAVRDSTKSGIDPSVIGEDTAAFVRYTPGKREGTIYVTPAKNIGKRLTDSEAAGWFGEGTGNLDALFTHEAAHALLHSDRQVKQGFFGSKVVSASGPAREKALKALDRQAKHDGVPIGHIAFEVSDYAGHSNTMQEFEAEMFAQYHWSPNPPNFVKAWGQTLHKELGVDPTPFREVVNHG